MCVCFRLKIVAFKRHQTLRVTLAHNSPETGCLSWLGWTEMLAHAAMFEMKYITGGRHLDEEHTSMAV
jgi:hypothetical protein